jgi:hypothetical protein
MGSSNTSSKSNAAPTFFQVVGDMVTTGYEESHPADNLLMEIKGYKFAQNKVLTVLMYMVSSLLLSSLLLSIIVLLLLYYIIPTYCWLSSLTLTTRHSIVLNQSPSQTASEASSLLCWPLPSRRERRMRQPPQPPPAAKSRVRRSRSWHS